MPKKFNRNNWLKGKLRFISLRYPPRNEALKAARKERGKYECAMCHDLFKSTQVHLDHKEPVVPLNNDWEYMEIKWDVYIDRLLPDVDGWQVLCKVCHSSKTEIEDQMRVSIRDIKKKSKTELDKKYQEIIKAKSEIEEQNENLEKVKKNLDKKKK